MVSANLIRQLHEEHQAALTRFLKARWPRHYEDLLQEVWERALRELGPETANPRAWLFRVAGNLGIDRVARKRRPGELPDAQAQLLPDPTADAVEEALQSERAQQLRGCVGRLSEQERTVVVGKLIDGRSHDCLAQQLETTAANTAKWLFRAKQKLVTCMGGGN